MQAGSKSLDLWLVSINSRKSRLHLEPWLCSNCAGHLPTSQIPLTKLCLAYSCCREQNTSTPLSVGNGKLRPEEWGSSKGKAWDRSSKVTYLWELQRLCWREVIYSTST